MPDHPGPVVSPSQLTCLICRFRTVVYRAYLPDDLKGGLLPDIRVPDFNAMRAALADITSAISTFDRARRTIEERDLNEAARAHELGAARRRRDDAVNQARHTYTRLLEEHAADVARPRQTSLTADGWAELAYREQSLARQLAAAHDAREALALYQRAAGEAPEWARPALNRVAEQYMGRVPAEMDTHREFAQSLARNRTDQERADAAVVAAAAAMRQRADLLDWHIGHLREQSEGIGDVDARVLGQMQDAVQDAAHKAALGRLAAMDPDNRVSA